MAKQIFRAIVDSLLLILVYYITAHVSVALLSTPPSYATAIWPPTGISLAVVLLRGYRLLPAVFISGLISTIEIVGFSDSDAITFSLMVGFQAMITAWIGAFFIRRFIGVDNLLIDNKSIILFFLFAGPVSLLLPSAFALGIEYWLEMVEANELLLGFFTWWLGGTIGAVIFAPITLILLGGKAQRQRIMPVVVPLSILFVLLVWLFSYTKDSEERRLEAAFYEKSQVLHAKTLATLNSLERELQGLKVFVSLTADIEQHVFKGFAQNVLTHNPRLSALAWLPRINNEKRREFESGIGRSVFKEDKKGKHSNSEIKADYYPVKYIESLDNYQQMVGLDFASNKSWKQVLDNAKHSAEGKIIMPVNIHQKGKTSKITVLVMAVFNDEGVDSVIEGKEALAGYVMLFLPLHKIMNNAVKESQGQYINLSIAGVGVNGNKLIGQLEKNHYSFGSTEELQHFGHKVVFTYSPSDEFVTDNSSLPVSWVFIMGLGVTGLVGFALLSVTGQTAQVQKIVEKKTKALQSKQQLLQTVLDSVQEGIVACDEQGNMTVFNKAAEKIFCDIELADCKPGQWSECFEIESVQGGALLKKNELPLLRLLAAKQLRNFEFVLIPKNSSKRVLMTNSTPILNDNKQIKGVVASFQNITRQKQVTDELKKLSWAVQYSPSSILITDSKGCIEYVNDKFVEMTGYSFQEVEGKSPRLLATGENSKKKYKELWDTILAGKEWRGEFHNQRKNGTFYWSKQIVAPIMNDQQKITHIVAMQEDITEEREAADIISYQASHDELTGLLNRRELETRLGKTILGAQIQQSKHVFCFLDLDKFKIVNDTCGHLAGDDLLREVCELFKSHLRQRDTLARIGGDEFGIIMEHCSIEQAEIVANKICHTIDAYKFTWEDQLFHIGVSIGLTAVDSKSSNFTKVISQADDACYKAKEHGRGQVCIF